jgi:hypothetical protein
LADLKVMGRRRKIRRIFAPKGLNEDEDMDA